MTNKARVNQLLFTQTSLDSGSLSILGAVIHSFAEQGGYRGIVLRNDRAVGRFNLIVDDDCADTQVNIDLASLKEGDDFRVSPKGVVVFHVSHGAGGYTVRVGRRTGDKEEQVFDSQDLRNGDMFTATLIRPGTYTVVNLKNRSSGEIVVSYPVVGSLPYRPPDPVSIAAARALQPDQIKVAPAQGQIYRIGTASRIRIDLVKPDDGGRDTRRPIGGWRKPRVATKSDKTA